MHLDHEGRLIVNAPAKTPVCEIEKFLEAHRGWIEGQLAKRKKMSFADGERVELMGKSYIVTAGAAKLAGETLRLPEEGREDALEKLLRTLTRKRMRSLLDEVCEKYGFSYTRLSVTSARGRWGSCSAKGHISFSFRGAFLPDALAYYLAVHELCHTRHLDHSPRFWAEVSNILPDYRALRAELKTYHWAMDCL